MWWTDTKWWKYEYSKWKDLRGVSSEEWSYANPQYRSVWSISLDFPRMIHSPFCWFIRIFKLSPHIFPNHKNGLYKFVLQVHHSQLARLTNRLMSLMPNGKWQTGQEVQDNKQSNKQTNKQTVIWAQEWSAQTGWQHWSLPRHNFPSLFWLLHIP